MSNQLTGKAAFITSGSRGIGAAIARRLAREGAAVAFTFTSAASKAAEVVPAIEEEGGSALALQADSGDPEAVKRAITETVKVFGRLDVLVNNAGIAVIKPFDQFTLDEWDQMVAVNVRAIFVAAQEASRHMGEGGRIITVGSGVADSAPFPGVGDYAATKAAVQAYTRGWARDLGSKGITVNIVQPGPINTEMNPENGDFAAIQKAATALGRYGRPEEVAAAIVFLAGPDASYITGATLNVDGGFSA